MTKRPPEPLTRKEALMLVYGANTRRKTGVRNAAVIALMWRSQLRIGETLDLRPCDYEGDRIRILHGKGSKSRVVGVDQGTKGLIDTWMLIKPKSDYLFPNNIEFPIPDDIILENKPNIFEIHIEGYRLEKNFGTSRDPKELALALVQLSLE